MAKVTYGDGTVINFGGQPSQADIEEAYNQVKGQSGTQQETPLSDTGFSLPSRSTPEAPSEPSPLNPIERGIVAIPHANDYKRTALSMIGIKPEDVGEDSRGKLTIKGKPIDPRPDGIISFLRDLPGDITEGSIELSPAIAQIATDVAMTASGPQALPALATGGAMASAGAEGLRQTISNQMTGEPFSGAEVATQGALGASVPYVGAGIGKVGELGVKAFAKPLSMISKKLGDSTPALMETIGQIPRGETENLMAQMKNGVSAESILNPKNADPSVAQGITRRTFFGHSQADETLDNFIKTYRQHYNNASISDKPLIQDMYKQSWGLSNETVTQMGKYNASELLNPQNTSDKAYRLVSEDIIKTIRNADEQLDVRYGQLLDKALTGPKAKASIDIKSSFNKMIQELDANTPGGLGILSNGDISKTYEGPAKDAYAKVIKRFIHTSKFSPDSLEIKGVVGGIGSTDKLIEYLGKQEINFGRVIGEAIDRLPAKEVYGIMRDLKPLLNKTFTNLTEQETRPLRQFLSSIRGQLDQLSPELSAFKPKYATFNNLRDLFGTLNIGDFNSAKQAQSMLKQAYTDGSLKSYVNEIDNFVKGPKIMPRLNKLGASQELQSMKDRSVIDKAKQAFINKLRVVNSKNEQAIMVKEELSRWDSAIRQNSFKFLQDAKNHSTAVAYNANHGNIFRARAIAYLLGFGSMATGNPMVGLPLLGMGIAAQSPKNLGGAISLGQKASGTSIPKPNPELLRGLLSLASRSNRENGR